MSQAAKVPPECVRMNHDLFREGVFNIKDLDQIVRRAVCIMPNSFTLITRTDKFIRTSPKQTKRTSSPCAPSSSTPWQMLMEPQHTSLVMGHALLSTQRCHHACRFPLTDSSQCQNGCCLSTAHCILSLQSYSNGKHSWKIPPVCCSEHQLEA